MSDIELELQNISLTAFLVLDISSTHFAMWFDMVLVFGVWGYMWAKHTVCDSLRYPDSLRREHGSRHTKVMWLFHQRTKLGPKQGFGQMQFPHEKWGDHLLNQTNEPLAVHSHTQTDISAAMALVKQHIKHQALEQIISGTGRILVFQNIQILNSSELSAKASGQQ